MNLDGPTTVCMIPYGILDASGIHYTILNLQKAKQKHISPPTFNRPKKNRFLIENPGKFRIWGLVGSGGAIFIVNFNKRMVQKLRRIILFHLGLVIVRFPFGKASQKQSLWETPIYQNISRNN